MFLCKFKSFFKSMQQKGREKAFPLLQVWHWRLVANFEFSASKKGGTNNQKIRAGKQKFICKSGLQLVPWNNIPFADKHHLRTHELYKKTCTHSFRDASRRETTHTHTSLASTSNTHCLQPFFCGGAGLPPLNDIVSPSKEKNRAIAS